MSFLLSQIPRLPLLLLFVVAMAVAVKRRQTLGASWWLTAAGCAIWSFLWLTTAAFMGWQTSGGASTPNVGIVYAVFQYVSMFLDLIGTGLVLMAALRMGPRVADPTRSPAPVS